MKINLKLVLAIILLSSYSFVVSATDTVPKNSEDDKAYQLIKKLVDKVGSYDKLIKKKDVTYTYTYQTPDGSKDQSIEKYIFDGELSYGEYVHHGRTFPDLEGTIEQGYDGNEYWLKHKGQIINDADKLKRVAFNRPTNYYWFTMFQKLMDPGVKYDYVGEYTEDNQTYDIVKVSFESKNDTPTDIYQLYINRKTSLVDQFLFTVVDFNVVETPLLMKVEYEKIDGFYIPTKRKYKKSTWTADVSDDPWIKVYWTNISFNNNFKRASFSKNAKM